MTDAKLAPIAEVVRDHDLDAVTFVPGPNFQRLFAANFHLMERPLVVIVLRSGEPVAIVPSLEMASFDALNFPGEAFPWADKLGYTNAFTAAAAALPT